MQKSTPSLKKIDPITREEIKPQPCKGLGDVVEKIAEATGLDKVADAAAKMTGRKDCGCKKRKEWLNEKFPFKGESQE